MEVVNFEKKELKLKQAIEKLNKREYKEAYEVFNELSQDNYAPVLAKLYLGIMYLQGYYVQTDYKKAYSIFEEYYGEWFYRDAAYLGLMNFYGIGVEQNYKNAWTMFHHLQPGMGGDDVVNSDVISLFCIAELYYYGNGVNKNRELAIKYLEEVSKKEFSVIEKDIIKAFGDNEVKALTKSLKS